MSHTTCYKSLRLVTCTALVIHTSTHDKYPMSLDYLQSLKCLRCRHLKMLVLDFDRIKESCRCTSLCVFPDLVIMAHSFREMKQIERVSTVKAMMLAFTSRPGSINKLRKLERVSKSLAKKSIVPASSSTSHRRSINNNSCIEANHSSTCF